MNTQHKELANGRWQKMSFCEQMANIGSEIERSINWRTKNNTEYSQKAFYRALELLELTINCVTIKSHFKELTRLKEVLLDFFLDNNYFNSTNDSIKKFFYHFAFAVRLRT